MGLISTGDRGKLVPRLLLTLAYDQAQHSQHSQGHIALIDKIPPNPTPETICLPYSRPILLVDFLKALISLDWIDVILDSYPTTITKGNPLSRPFREALKDAYINFTHFVRAGDSRDITYEGAWLSLVRGMGIQCSSRQPMIDIFLPVLLRDEKIGRHVMSRVFIQIKNRGQTQDFDIDAERLNFFSPDKSGNIVSRPYVCIVMNLGVHQGFDNPTRPRPVKRPRINFQGLNLLLE